MSFKFHEFLVKCLTLIIITVLVFSNCESHVFDVWDLIVENLLAEQTNQLSIFVYALSTCNKEEKKRILHLDSHGNFFLFSPWINVCILSMFYFKCQEHVT